MAEPIENTAGSPQIAEHLEAVISGRLRKALLLTFVILAVELTGAVLSHSLALFSDAGHVTTDILALGLAWFAVEQTKRPADDKRSFGYHRAGILAATANGATLIVLVFVIAYEAVQRLTHPEPVQGGIVIVSALVGAGVNGYVALSMRGQGKNLNIRAALLHALGDLAASVGVIIAGAVILLTGWTFIDPLVSILIAALIGWNALKIVTETVNILLEGTPRGVSSLGIASAIRETAGVQSMHDLHIWSISAENLACSCHIVVPDQSLPDSERVMRAVEERLCADFGIGHTTIQVENCTPCHEEAEHLMHHNHPHLRLAELALEGRRRTPLSSRRRSISGRPVRRGERDRQSPGPRKERAMAEYGTSVDSTAPADKVWKIWSDMSTWGDWNPNVSTMDWQGGFADGTAGIMNTRAGQHHKMRLVDVVPGRSFALVTSVVPGTTFRFNCKLEPAGDKTMISQTVEVKGPLGPLLGGMLGPQVSKEFGTLLGNLAKRAETA